MSAPRPILIHGSGGDHRVWALQTARLEGALALDLPGHPDGEAATDAGALAEACAARHRIRRRSRGCWWATRWAVRSRSRWPSARPELVDGLILVASAARLPVPDATVARARDDFAAERERLVAGSFADVAAPMAGHARAALDACGPVDARSPTTRRAAAWSCAGASGRCGCPPS